MSNEQSLIRDPQCDIEAKPRVSSSLFDFEGETNITYNNIVYPNTAEVIMKNGKPKESWMKNWTQEERFDKFFEFCHAFDKRQDKLLLEDYQIFSHRLHWHEHPYCYMMQHETDLEKLLYYTIVFSFSNEHWGTITRLIKDGEEKTRQHFVENRHARNDLFQIYYPKGTQVKDWLLDGPKKAAKDMVHILENLDRPYTMMEFAKKLEKYFKEHQGFRSPLYPCKNTARYVAMSRPDLVDPESILFGGTGHFDGMQQIFGGPNLNGKVKYNIDKNGQFIAENNYAEMWIEQMNILANHPNNPMTSQKMLNVEDKTCFFYKHIAISHGIKSPTKRIPYTWIFDGAFNLAKHPTENVIVNAETTKYLWGREYPNE
jgi:hypothetical protein